MVSPRLLASLALLFVFGCPEDPRELDGGTDASVDAGDAADDGEISLDGSFEAPEDTVILTEMDDGTQVGLSVLGDDGAAHFYSESLNAFWEYTPTPAEETAIEATTHPSVTEVYVQVDPDGMSHYFIWDPTGETMPISFTAPMPEDGSHELVVDPLEQLEDGDEALAFDPMPETDPFGDFTIAGLSVNISVSGIAQAMVIGAVVSVFKNLVVGACNIAAPLYDDVCGVVGTVIELLALFVRPGFKLATGAVDLAGAAVSVSDNFIEYVAGKACNAGTVAVMKAIDDTDEQVLVLRQNFRRAVGEFHYLMYKLENDPPEGADTAAIRRALGVVGAGLSAIGPHIREGYVTILNTEGMRPTEEPVYKNSIDLVKNIIGEAEFAEIIWEDVVLDEVSREMFGPLPGGGIVLVDVPVGRIDASIETTREIEFRVKGVPIIGPMADCVVNVWQGIEAEAMRAAARESLYLSMPQLYLDETEVAHQALQHLYNQYFGGGDIPVECEFDEYEPNETWRAALASPSVSVGDGPVRIRDLTICAIEGEIIEEDWYAFPMGPIDFRVQARMRQPENEDYHFGGEEPVQLNLFYYGQTNELADLPPTSILSASGTAWGTATAERGVRRAIGESYAFILVQVVGTGSEKFAYDLGFQ